MKSIQRQAHVTMSNKKVDNLLTIKEASVWASKHLNRQVTTSNISYLIQYGKIKKYTILKPAIISFSLSILILCSCSRDKSPKVLSLEEKFNQYYQEWKDETHLSVHSDTGWYTSRSSFRKIVGLGMDAIPLIEEKKDSYFEAALSYSDITQLYARQLRLAGLR